MAAADPRPLWIVDGDNVSHGAGRGGGHLRDRARLVGEVTDLMAQLGAECVIVFDGAGSDRELGGTAVRFSGGVTADTVIERLAHRAAAARRDTTVVSSDSGIRHVAHREGVHVMSVREFLERLRAEPETSSGSPSPRQRYRLGDALDPSVQDALERIRRGQ
ncbi:MAG TPA: NYN domain-containing protein [Gaiellales bacterium]|nr:NYN domain-containing protein [Gaiellales bacterium]